jgi:uncharacterized iron-regulated membrane protein
MKFATLRNTLFQIHMWIGLIAGILFILLGLSGSIIVYGNDVARLLSPTPAATAQGTPLPLEKLADSVKSMAPAGRAQLQINLPQGAGQPAVLRFVAQRGGRGGPGAEAGGGRRGGRGPDATPQSAGPQAQGAARPQPPVARDIFVDPVSGQVLGSRASNNSFVATVRELHESLFLGRSGRNVVGWLGVGMTLLGLSGLVLWWPRRGQWKYAFGVRRTAKGARFWRELHAMAGIWGFIVFIFVSITGVALGFPQTTQALLSGGNAPAGPPGPPPGFGATPTVEPADGATAISADQAVALVKQDHPDATVRSVTLPARPTQPIAVALAGGGDRPVTVYVDPYRSTVLATPERPRPQGGGRINFEALHGGEALGPVWQFLVFLVGFLPLLFVISGATMWWKKHQARMPMNKVLD